MTELLLLAIVGAAAHFLAWRAKATRWLWKRYPTWLVPLMSCSACLGFWVGCAAGGAWAGSGRSAWGLAGWILVPLAGLSTMVLAPVVAYVQLRSLESLITPDEGIEQA